MRVSRLMGSLAVAGLTTTGTLGLVANPAAAVSNDRFGCYAYANPSDGPPLASGAVSGQGKGLCKPEEAWNVKFDEVFVLIEVRRLDSDPWLYGYGTWSTKANTTQYISMACLSGSWSYRVTTQTYGKDGNGNPILQSWVSTPANRYSCK